MHLRDISPFEHDHVFGQDQVKAGERRTLLVVGLTAVMMVVEVAAGLMFGSMALLADGLHMASHATALSIAVAAYVLVRRLAADRRFTFGTGKLNSLAGFGSAVLLVGFAAVMAVESCKRLIAPVPIDFDDALIVAGIGLVVNGVSAWVLVGSRHDHPGHRHSHGTAHDHQHDHDHGHGHGHGHDHHQTDHNLRAAYFHVLADALTSLLAIVALLAGKFYGANWLDPVMGLVGAALVARWSVGLMRDSGGVLLDRQADRGVEQAVRDAIERDSGDRIADMHIWEIGPGIRAAELAIVSDAPKTPDHYRALLPAGLNIRHCIVEVQVCAGHKEKVAS